MSEASFYFAFFVAWLALSAVIFVYLLLRPAPYGRHKRRGWGPEINATPGWVLMELPAVAAFTLFFVLGLRHVSPITLTFFFLWQFHYVYRTFIFPFRLPDGAKPMPVVIALSGLLFNAANAYLNGRYLFHLAPEYSFAWFADFRFLGGIALFAIGFGIHYRADAVLLALKKQGGGYQIPRGGLYRFIACPNYLGEMLQWGGWALLTWSPGGLAFFVWTTANLLPRALAHHRWYRRTFPDYPPNRRAVIPFLL